MRGLAVPGRYHGTGAWPADGVSGPGPDAPAAFGSTLAQWTGSGDGEDRWRSRLADVALNVVLLVDGEPAGMVSALDPNEDSAVELISMWVAPCARGQGVGDAAVRHVVSWAQTEHGASVVLAVKTDNDHAVCLYQRHGFVDAGPSLDDPSERLMTAGIAEAKNDSG